MRAESRFDVIRELVRDHHLGWIVDAKTMGLTHIEALNDTEVRDLHADLEAAVASQQAVMQKSRTG